MGVPAAAAAVIFSLWFWLAVEMNSTVTPGCCSMKRCAKRLEISCTSGPPQLAKESLVPGASALAAAGWLGPPVAGEAQALARKPPRVSAFSRSRRLVGQYCGL